MKPSSFILALLCAFSMAFVSCENNDPDMKKGGDDTTSQHQPANPATWSPNGHRYAAPYEGDDYGFYVYQFFSQDSVLAYQTIKSDYSLDEEYQYTYKQVGHYTIDYPCLIIGRENLKLTFRDTTEIFYPLDGRGDYGLTYMLVD